MAAYESHSPKRPAPVRDILIASQGCPLARASTVYGEDSLPLLDNAEVTLVVYNKTEEKPIGKKRVQVVNPRNGRKYSVEFVVVKGKGKLLLGLRASEQMQLISVVRQNIVAIQSEEPW